MKRKRQLIVFAGAAAMTAMIAGILFPTAYQIAGGDAEWRVSGVTRIDLNRLVSEVADLYRGMVSRQNPL